MTTPDEPETPQLTRRQLRELRNTASTPIITPEEAEAAAAAVSESADESPAPAAPVAPLPRAVEPLPAAEEPPVAEDVDLHAPALTRRAARQQERLRTASVPVIEPEDADAVGDTYVVDSVDAVEPAAVIDVADVPEGGDDSEAAAPVDAEVVEAADAPLDAEPVEAPSGETDAPVVAEPVEAASAEDDASVVAEFVEASSDEDDASEVADAPDVVEASEAAEPVEAPSAEPEASEEPRPVVAPTFGSELLAGENVELELPASFDQLLTRSPATGALSASNALILSQTPETASLVSPVTATGEVLITGTYNLPEAFGSTGTSRGSSDGKEIDAILVDGELPATSSPTPIAASAAISTIKSAEDIINPPAPEKGSRLMLTLVIPAGALALALTGVLIVALVTGAFQ